MGNIVFKDSVTLATLASGQNNWVQNLAIDPTNHFVFGHATGSGGFRFVKINGATMTVVNELTIANLSQANYGRGVYFDPSVSKVWYFVFNTSTNHFQLKRFDSSSFGSGVELSIDLGTYPAATAGNSINAPSFSAFDPVGRIFYAFAPQTDNVMNNYVSHVWASVNLASQVVTTGTIVLNMTADPTNRFIYDAVFASDGFIYAPVSANPGVINKITPVTSTTSITLTGQAFVGAIQFNANTNKVYTADRGNGGSGLIRGIDLGSFTLSDSVATSQSALNPTNFHNYFVDDSTNNLLYWIDPLGSLNEKIYKLDISPSLAVESTLTIVTDFQSIAVDGAGAASEGYLYVSIPSSNSTSTSPAQLNRYYVNVVPPMIPGSGGFSPVAVAVGDTVILSGSSFTGATAVNVNGTSAAFTVVTDKIISLVVPNGATTGFITVTGPGGTATTGSKLWVDTALTGPAILHYS